MRQVSASSLIVKIKNIKKILKKVYEVVDKILVITYNMKYAEEKC